MEDELRSLSKEIHDLIDKLDAPKRRDIWDKLSVLTTFVASVVIAALSLYFSTRFQSNQQDFEKQRHNSELELKQLDFLLRTEIARAEVRVAELDAVSKLVPQLTSTDAETRTVARAILETVRDGGDTTIPNVPVAATVTEPPASLPPRNQTSPTSRLPPTASPSSRAAIVADISILERLAAVALAVARPLPERVAATQQIAALLRRGTSAQVRERAEEVATTLIKTESPLELKAAASEILKLIRQVNPSEAQNIIAESNPKTRAIDKIVIHHTYAPSAAQYRGGGQVLAIARFQLEQQHWKSVSWHFAIAPDGMVWLGMPLEKPAIHIGRHDPRKSTASVTLILNGDIEDMPAAQAATLEKILQSIVDRYNLVGASAVMLHREYDSTKSCPGGRISKESVVGSLD